MFQDTQVTSTAFLKKCVRVPKIETKAGGNYEGLTEEEHRKAKEAFAREAFKRGSMNFEDYNYRQSNKYILVDSNYQEDQYVSDPELSQFTDEMSHAACQHLKKGK